jgi:cytochrome c
MTYPRLVLIGWLLMGPAVAQADGDAEAGKKLFLQRCNACHSPEANINKQGPSLFGVVGRPAGKASNYNYSESHRKAADKGLVWQSETLFDYLREPREFLKAYLGDPNATTKMTSKYPDEKVRRDVIAYLKTLK